MPKPKPITIPKRITASSLRALLSKVTVTQREIEATQPCSGGYEEVLTKLHSNPIPGGYYANNGYRTFRTPKFTADTPVSLALIAKLLPHRIPWVLTIPRLRSVSLAIWKLRDKQNAPLQAKLTQLKKRRAALDRQISANYRAVGKLEDAIYRNGQKNVITVLLKPAKGAK